MTGSMTAATLPVPFIPPPRTIADWDEKGFPLLASECPNPACGASALILNEWDAIVCLSCSWCQFTHDTPSADCSKWPDETYATDPEWTDQAPRLVDTVVVAGGAL
jgi:hypothetical protein